MCACYMILACVLNEVGKVLKVYNLEILRSVNLMCLISVFVIYILVVRIYEVNLDSSTVPILGRTIS